MRLKCRQCGEPISSENINLHHAIAKCGKCHDVFSFAENFDISIHSGEFVKTSKKQTRPKIAKPDKVSIREEGIGLLISQRWFSLKYIPLAFFCVAWDSFLIFWYSIAVVSKGPWIMFVFPIAHVAVGVGLTYATLAGFLNKSHIYVTNTEFTIRHSPLPWTGNIRLSVFDLDQLFCQDEVNTGESGKMYSYQLCALFKDGRKIKLLSNLESVDVALYMEQKIESWLRIKDRPVAGEIER